MISVNEALNIIIDESLEPQKEKIHVSKSFGYVLSDDIKAKDKIPPFDNSAMDGYAIKAVDSGEGSKLKVIEELPAGKPALKKIETGQASIIMTGSPIPEGADSVIEVEATDGGRKEVILKRKVKEGENVRIAGEDIKPGTKVSCKGDVITPVEMGLAASLGYLEIPAYKKPAISILSTGSEVVSPGEELSPGKIRDSNTFSLTGQCLSLGIEPVIIGIAKDDIEDTKKKLSQALRSDVVITTGGVSVGEYDFIKEVLESLQAKKIIWGIKQKPGKPFAFYRLGNKVIFGLPGNPVAALVCFEIYIRPFLLKSMGATDIFQPVIRVINAEKIKKRKGRANWLRVNLKEDGNCLKAYMTGPQGSGILTSMKADGLLFLPEESEGLEKDEEAEVLLMKK